MFLKRLGLLAAGLMFGVAVFSGPSARAAFDGGSDGTDGALDCAWLAAHDDTDDYPDGFQCAHCPPDDLETPNVDERCTFVVDLSKALSAPDTTWRTPGNGLGVYDARQWTVVYKFTTIDVPTNVIVKFKNHPSGAPVAWLAQSEVTIRGWVNLNGQDGYHTQIWPSFSEPGPGGFPGGAPAEPTTGRVSIGFGPGSRSSDGNPGSACYSDVSAYSLTRPVCFSTYGSINVFPLIGGSGAGIRSEPSFQRRGVGGAGGGAILIATDTDIEIAQGGRITAWGGGGPCSFPPEPSDGQRGPQASGGAIRLVAGLSFRDHAPYNQHCFSGDWRFANPVDCPLSAAPERGNCISDGILGRVRVEARQFYSDLPSTAFVTTSFDPGLIFPDLPGDPTDPNGPNGDAPVLEVISISDDGVPIAAPADPAAGPESIELELDTDTPSQVVIRACNIPPVTGTPPVATRIQVRIVPVLGNEIIVNSGPLAGPQADGCYQATANVAFPSGRSEIQLRANW